MPSIQVLTMQGIAAGEMNLSDEIFGLKPNVAAMHLVVRSIQANKRQGTQSALTRGMVRGGGRKIYRQKGTGNARHHSNRAPQFRHGGVVFAPQPRDYVVGVPKKVRRLAMKSALSAKFSAGDIIVLDKIALKEAKTKYIARMLTDLKADKSVLLVMPGADAPLVRASRNIALLTGACVNTLNVYDILHANKLIILSDAIKGIEEVYV